MKDSDFLIIGGGCSGISLAVEIVAAGLENRGITILESHNHLFQSNKTWCFWNTQPHRFQSSISKRWKKWTIVHSGEIIRCSSNQYDYCHISSSRYIESAMKRLSSRAQVKIFSATRVEQIVEHQDHVIVSTNQGDFRGRYVFDSRPSFSLPDQEILTQQFMGHFLEFDGDCVEADSVTLMDFSDFDQSLVSFIYELPFDSRNTLVEATFFAKHHLDKKIFETAIEKAVRKRYGEANYRITSTEYGIIPMSADYAISQENKKRVLNIGLRAGMARSSTGYAFLNIQRSSAEIVNQLRNGSTELNPPTILSPTLKFLDRVFLDRLCQEPQWFAAAVTRLFKQVPTDSMVRFLSGSPNSSDIASVVGAMPNKTALLLGAFSHAGADIA
ncbi:MAG: NAD(P)-binding domain-containing protein [Candidatus Obscuribacterales bacterium]|nr:NAD(P)-binding domain-containing protein [Candidatus Obscuribacterales bacterium]